MPARPNILARRARNVASPSSSSSSSPSSSSITRLTRPVQQHSAFSTTSTRRYNSSISPKETHYDILGVDPTISAAELKTRFYTLSRSTHPDLNRHDPSAQARFQAISESYSVLANPEKRSRYDREVMAPLHRHRSHHHHHHHHHPQHRRQHQHQHQHQHHPHHDHHHDLNGGTYAGSRPARGLSKRRSAFRGPPPSYFRHGGGGDNSSSSSNSNARASNTTTTTAGARPSGVGDAWAGAAEFDPTSTLRTQTIEDERRDRRREAAAAAAIREGDDAGNFWARFLIVTVIVTGGVSVGSLVSSYWDQRPRGGLVRGDGTLRKASSSSSLSSLSSSSSSSSASASASASSSFSSSSSSSSPSPSYTPTSRSVAKKREVESVESDRPVVHAGDGAA